MYAWIIYNGIASLRFKCLNTNGLSALFYLVLSIKRNLLESSLGGSHCFKMSISFLLFSIMFVRLTLWIKLIGSVLVFFRNSYFQPHWWTIRKPNFTELVDFCKYFTMISKCPFRKTLFYKIINNNLGERHFNFTKLLKEIDDQK